MNSEIRLFWTIAWKVNGSWEKIWQQVRLERCVTFQKSIYQKSIQNQNLKINLNLKESSIRCKIKYANTSIYYQWGKITWYFMNDQD